MSRQPSAYVDDMLKELFHLCLWIFISKSFLSKIASRYLTSLESWRVISLMFGKQKFSCFLLFANNGIVVILYLLKAYTSLQLSIKSTASCALLHSVSRFRLAASTTIFVFAILAVHPAMIRSAVTTEVAITNLEGNLLWHLASNSDSHLLECTTISAVP